MSAGKSPTKYFELVIKEFSSLICHLIIDQIYQREGDSSFKSEKNIFLTREITSQNRLCPTFTTFIIPINSNNLLIRIFHQVTSLQLKPAETVVRKSS